MPTVRTQFLGSLTSEQRERHSRQVQETVELEREQSQELDRFFRRMRLDQRPRAERQIFTGAERRRTNIDMSEVSGEIPSHIVVTGGHVAPNENNLTREEIRDRGGKPTGDPNTTNTGDPTKEIRDEIGHAIDRQIPPWLADGPGNELKTLLILGGVGLGGVYLAGQVAKGAGRGATS